MKYLILILVFASSTLSAQVEMQTGYGYGNILGSYKAGNSLSGSISYQPNEKWEFVIKGSHFISSSKAFDMFGGVLGEKGPTLIENTLSNPIPVLNSRTEAALYEGKLKVLRSEIQKDNYYTIDLLTGYTIFKGDKSELVGRIGGSYTKFDQVTLQTKVSATINIGGLSPEDDYPATLYSSAFVTYLDVGFAFGLQYKYRIYKTMSLGAEAVINRYIYSDDGYYHGSLFLAIAI